MEKMKERKSGKRNQIVEKIEEKHNGNRITKREFEKNDPKKKMRERKSNERNLGTRIGPVYRDPAHKAMNF